MENKTCDRCNIKNQTKKFYKIFKECKTCSSKKGLERYYDIKDKSSKQQISKIKKKTKDNIIQQENDSYTHFNDKVRSYVELDSQLKMLEHFSQIVFQKNTQKTINISTNEIYSKQPKKHYTINKTDVLIILRTFGVETY